MCFEKSENFESFDEKKLKLFWKTVETMIMKK